MEALAQIAAQLGLDSSFFILFGMMFVLYLLLSAVYLKPFQHLLHDRKLKTEGAKKEAEELKTRAEQQFQSYKTRLKAAHENARSVLNDSEATARKEEGRIIGEAANKAKNSLQEMQKDLAAQRKAIIDTLAGDISGIANDIATKVMGRR